MRTAIVVGAVVVVLAVGATVYASTREPAGKKPITPKGSPSPFIGGEGLPLASKQRQPLYGPVTSAPLAGVTFGPGANAQSPASKGGGDVRGESSVSNCEAIAAAAQIAATAAASKSGASAKVAYEEGRSAYKKAKQRCEDFSILDPSSWF